MGVFRGHIRITPLGSACMMPVYCLYSAYIPPLPWACRNTPHTWMWVFLWSARLVSRFAQRARPHRPEPCDLAVVILGFARYGRDKDCIRASAVSQGSMICPKISLCAKIRLRIMAGNRK